MQRFVPFLKCAVKFGGQNNELFGVCFLRCFGCDFLPRSRHTRLDASECGLGAKRGEEAVLLTVMLSPNCQMSSSTTNQGKKELRHTVCTVLNIRPVFGILRFAALGIANSQWMPCRAAHTQPKIFVSTTSIRVPWSDRSRRQVRRFAKTEATADQDARQPGKCRGYSSRA